MVVCARFLFAVLNMSAHTIGKAKSRNYPEKLGRLDVVIKVSVASVDLVSNSRPYLL